MCLDLEGLNRDISYPLKKKTKKKESEYSFMFVRQRVLKKSSFLENPLLYSVQMHDSKKKSLIKSVKKNGYFNQ